MTERRVAHHSPGPDLSASPGAAWFALRLKSRREFAVRDALDTAGIEQFLPTWEERSAWSDRIAKVTRPLFRGYIFARLVPDRAPELLQIRGVCQVLGTSHPEAIPDEVMRNLQRIAALPGAFSPCPYVAGEPVTVRIGAYAGVEGIVVRTAGAAELVVSIELLGRSCRVRIDAADCE